MSPLLNIIKMMKQQKESVDDTKIRWWSCKYFCKMEDVDAANMKISLIWKMLKAKTEDGNAHQNKNVDTAKKKSCEAIKC